jgi:aminopeptidase N
LPAGNRRQRLDAPTLPGGKIVTIGYTRDVTRPAITRDFFPLLGLLVPALATLGCDGEVDPCLPSGCVATRDYDVHAYALRGSVRGDDLVASEDIALTLAPGAPRIVELDAAVDVRAVRVADSDVPFVRLPDDTLRVDLATIPGDAPLTVTVEYRARGSREPGIAPLTIVREGGRTIYTQAEPDRGKGWLVGNHDPSDRAAFAVELTVAAGEDVVANGRRVIDRASGDQRTIRYEMAQPLPTYIMAFAAGALDHASRDGTVPLEMWWPAGSDYPTDPTFDLLERQLTTLEALLGPYPFERYGVAFLPGFPGGMENAGISFLAGYGAEHERLNAHELAHQWFGDWVTMRSLDDAWIKEGMATLLEAEVTAEPAPGFAVPSLQGEAFGFFQLEPILDRSLVGLDRYTSGTYQRAAWLINQIRAIVGEETFWASVRRILEVHALDDIDSATFLASFGLDATTVERMSASLEVAAVPAIDIQIAAGDAGATEVALTVTDPGGVVFAPFEVTVVDAAGVATVHTLIEGTPVRLTVPAGGYIAPDERGVHPTWYASFAVDYEAFYNGLRPLFVPTAPAALTAYSTRSHAHVERVRSLES